MKYHYTDPSSGLTWLKQISLVARPIRSTTQIFVVTRHQYGGISRRSSDVICEETSGGWHREISAVLRLGTNTPLIKIRTPE